MNRNDILLPAADASSFDTALAAIKNRSLLYNTDTKRLYMKYGDVANLVTAQAAVDNVNIVLNDSDEVALADDISVKTATVTPLTGYPSMNDCIDFGVTTASSTIKLLCKKSDINMGAIGGELYESGTGLNSMYHFSLASNGSRFLGGSSSYSTKAYFVDCVYDGNEYYGIKFPSGINAQLLFHGYDNIPTLLAPPSSYQDTDFTAITALTNEADSSAITEVIDIALGAYEWDFTDSVDGFVSNSNNVNADFGNGLILKATCSTVLNPTYQTAWYTNDTTAKDIGYLYINNSSNPALALTVNNTSSYTISIYFYAAQTTRRVYITDSSGTELASKYMANVNSDTCTVLTYTDTTTGSHTLNICTSGGGLYIGQINITGSTASIADVLDVLPDTTEDGSPHYITITGELTAANILEIAAGCKDSDKQIALDLSRATVASDAVNWTSDNSLNIAFRSCVGLRAFKMPQGVASIQGAAFAGCTFMREIELNSELTSFKGGGASYNEGCLSSTRVRDIEIPVTTSSIGEYAFKDSNVTTIVFDSPNACIAAATIPFAYRCFYDTKSELVIKMSQAFYNYCNGQYWAQESYCGIDVIAHTTIV